MRKILTFALLTVCAAHTCAAADDFAALRERLVLLYTGQAGATGGPSRADAMARLDDAVARRLAETAAPRDPNPDDPDSMPNVVAAIFQRALPMAQAYAAPGGALRGSPELKARIESELARGLRWIAPGSARPGNWHPWIIRTPQALGTMLVLLRGKIDPKLEADCLAALKGLMGEPSLSGANAVWEARNHAYLAMLEGNERRMDRAMDFLLPELTVHDENGILEDYSYQFHGRLLHTSGYGTALARSAAEIVFLVEGTRWSVEPRKTRLLADHLLEHARWVIIGDRYDLSVKGRGVSNNWPSTQHVEAMLLLSAADPQVAGPLREGAAGMVARCPTPMPFTVAGLADGLTDLRAESLAGFRYFHSSDFAVFRRPEFYVSTRMYSSRLIDYEGNWGQNLQGWFLCYGLTYITRTGHEYWDDRETMSTYLDWDRLPGTTTRVGIHPSKAYNVGTTSFAGGAGSESAGVCAFRLEPAAADFTALKSYFFFRDGFAALGSGIVSRADHAEPVVTTVTQWAAPGDDVQLVLSNGLSLTTIAEGARWDGIRWAWLDGVGYVFPEPVMLCGQRRGNVTTLWLEHGADPQRAGYAYVVLPKAACEETRQFARQPAIRVLRRDEKVHACRYVDGSGATAMVFWQAADAGTVAVDRPAVAYLEERLDGLALAVQNPEHTRETLNVLVRSDPVRKAPAQVPPGADVSAESGGLRFRVPTAGGRMVRMAVGPCEVAQPARGDILPYAAFRAEGRTEGNVALITAHIPDAAMKEGYRLLIRGPKGHLRAELTDADRVGKPEGNAVRYRWTITAPVADGDDFRAVLVTPMHHVMAPLHLPRAM